MTPIPTPPNATHPKTRAQWRRWLAAHYTRREGVWLVSFKAATGKPRVGYAESVEEALCFGWIDSTAHTLDDERSMQWFAPRKPRTGWSRLNKQRIAQLIESGRMHEAGFAKIEQAKKDGSWSLLDEVEDLAVPADLTRAFKAYPGSRTNCEAFPPSARKGILSWIVMAKRPETRAARVEHTARLAQENVRANQWKPTR